MEKHTILFSMCYYIQLFLFVSLLFLYQNRGQNSSPVGAPISEIDCFWLTTKLDIMNSLYCLRNQADRSKAVPILGAVEYNRVGGSDGFGCMKEKHVIHLIIISPFLQGLAHLVTRHFL